MGNSQNWDEREGSGLNMRQQEAGYLRGERGAGKGGHERWEPFCSLKSHSRRAGGEREWKTVGV